VRRLASAEAAAALDASTAEACRVPPLLLMENAALRIWQALEPEARLAGALGSGEGDALLLALAGPGNNGGDALAVLRQARFAGFTRLAAILSSESPGELAAIQLSSLRAMGIELLVWSGQRERATALLEQAHLVLDGLAGTGLKGPLRGPSLEIAQALAGIPAERRPRVAAIDLPSGLSDGMEAGSFVLPAELCFSVEPAKASLYYPASRGASGRIIPIEGVFPADALPGEGPLLLEASDLAALAGAPRSSAHKGERGRLGLFAGSEGMLGAASFACRGAHAASVGLVEFFAGSGLYPGLAGGAGLGAFGSAVIRPEPKASGSGSSGLPEGLSSLHVLLVGPGWGAGLAHRGLLESILGLGLPTVLDADGVRLFAELLSAGYSPAADRPAPLILTPHPGEFEAISGIAAARALANPASILPAFAAKAGAIVVLKANVTWIASPEGRLAVWDGNEPSLGVAGSGDVLAGIMAGILAGKAARRRREGAASICDAHDDAWDAACAAVIAHGLAGRDARKELGWYEAPAIARAAARRLDPNCLSG
jgi:NAD(P)H-hydrate epimerase